MTAVTLVERVRALMCYGSFEIVVVVVANCAVPSGARHESVNSVSLRMGEVTCPPRGEERLVHVSPLVPLTVQD